MSYKIDRINKGITQYEKSDEKSSFTSLKHLENEKIKEELLKSFALINENKIEDKREELIIDQVLDVNAQCEEILRKKN